MEHDATDHGPMRILNPTMRQPEEDGKLAPRLDTLDGKTVGILGNGFPGADEMMTRVEEILWERFDLKGTVLKQKAYFGEPAPSETVEELGRFLRRGLHRDWGLRLVLLGPWGRRY